MTTRKKRKVGRPPMGDKKKVVRAFSISQKADENLEKLPPGERSITISDFLEKMDSTSERNS
jgi:hypothetical protein